MTTKRIITACSGYRPYQLVPFFSSLARIKFDGLVHAMIWEEDALLETYLAQQKVDIEVVRMGKRPSPFVNRVARIVSLLPMMKCPASGGAAIDSLVKSLILRNSLPISSLRYLICQEIVKGASDDSVFLLTDSRDVYFQRCPFEAYDQAFHGSLHLSMEDRKILPGDCTHRWLVDIYGETQVAAICLGKLVSCSGTTIGDKARVGLYLDAMVEEIIEHRWGISHTVGYDQGIHNYLYYGGYLSCVSNPANGDGIFWVMDSAPNIGDSGDVVSSAGVPIPVVHQYDRNMAAFEGSNLFKHISEVQRTHQEG
jgi:hypothetical protein